MILKKINIAIATALTALTAAASTPGETSEPLRPVQSAFMLEAGSSHLCDTYLTPLRYTGWHAAFSYERLQAMRFDPDRWVMRLELGVKADRTQNPTRNATMWYGGVEASWSMMRRWQLSPEGLSAGIGGMADVDLGCLVNSRNGNNPAAAKCAVTVGATGYLNWRTRLGRLPVALRETADLPVVGAFFAPDYGELYYEIWLGNHSGLVHPAWFGNYFRLRNLVSADLEFGGTTLRLGYRFEMNTSDVNSTVTRIFRHSAVIGVASNWISFSPRRTVSPQARIIEATY